jgi:hypothetical protein
LDIFDGGAVVELDEVDGLRGAVGAYPTADTYFFAVVGGLEGVYDFGSFHFII